MNNQENGIDKNFSGKYRILKKQYSKLIKRFTVTSILRYAFVTMFVVSTLFLVNYILLTNELKRENMMLHEENMEMTNQIDMYFDAALYFADMSIEMDETNINLKEIISNQEEELMAYREREELYDSYEWALYHDGVKTDITYYQIQSLSDYCDEKGYSSEMVDLVLAVAMKESTGREKAQNASGATGYCQLLNSTARFVYKELEGHETYTHDDALDGEKNLKMAADYLDYLYNYHGKNTIKMIDSYRGMHVESYINTIDKYLAKNGLSLKDIQLEKE